MKVNFTYNSLCRNRQKTFKAHPEYKILAKHYEINASSYFRRGGFYGSPSDEFINVVNLFKNIFNKNFDKKKMFIAGIGDSQEPFSLLAVIKNLINNKSLKDMLDLYIADLQSKPNDKKLFEQSYFDSHIVIMPNYAKDSFIDDDGEKYGLKSYKKFRVKDEIFDFLKQTYNNRKKSYWNSRVQDVVAEINDEQFDIVSINNTLGYIKDENVIADTLNNIKRITKKGGVFITDPYNKYDNLRDVMKEECKGIFRKI